MNHNDIAIVVFLFWITWLITAISFERTNTRLHDIERRINKKEES